MKGFRTIIFNGIAAIVPALEATEVATLVPAEYMPHYVAFVAVGNLILRAMTTTPIATRG